MTYKVTENIGTSWSEILQPRAEDKTLYAIGILVEVYQSPTEVTDFTTIDDNDISYIGGIKGSLDLYQSNYVYVKAHSSGQVYHLPKGMGDPDRDLSAINTLIAAINVTITNHLSADSNPHSVTKTQLGVNNLPNAITNDPSADDPMILLTSQGASVLLSMIQAHNALNNNPHTVTKAQVGLGTVNNFGIPINETQLRDAARNDLYTTVKNLHDLIAIKEQVTTNIHPNTLVKVNQLTQFAGDVGLTDPKTEALLYSGDDVVCPPGLQVVYSVGNRWYTTIETTSNLTISKDSISTVLSPQEGYHYVYANIDSSGNVTSIGHTQYRPYFGNLSIDSYSDFFDITTKLMYDETGTIIRRIYIGKIYVNGDGSFDTPISVPKGNRIIYKPGVNVAYNATYLFDNPFFEDVTVIPKILINDQWCDPKWDDQIGVSAIYDKQRPDNIIVQTGQLGLALPPKSGGNAFTDTNVPSTYQTDSPILLEIYKKGF